MPRYDLGTMDLRSGKPLRKWLALGDSGLMWLYIFDIAWQQKSLWGLATCCSVTCHGVSCMECLHSKANWGSVFTVLERSCRGFHPKPCLTPSLGLSELWHATSPDFQIFSASPLNVAESMGCELHELQRVAQYPQL